MVDAKARQDCIKEIDLLKVSGPIGECEDWTKSLSLSPSLCLSLLSPSPPSLSLPPSPSHYLINHAYDESSNWTTLLLSSTWPPLSKIMRWVCIKINLFTLAICSCQKWAWESIDVAVGHWSFSVCGIFSHFLCVGGSVCVSFHGWGELLLSS